MLTGLLYSLAALAFLSGLGAGYLLWPNDLALLHGSAGNVAVMMALGSVLGGVTVAALFGAAGRALDLLKTIATNTAAIEPVASQISDPAEIYS